MESRVCVGWVTPFHGGGLGNGRNLSAVVKVSLIHLCSREAGEGAPGCKGKADVGGSRCYGKEASRGCLLPPPQTISTGQLPR